MNWYLHMVYDSTVWSIYRWGYAGIVQLHFIPWASCTMTYLYTTYQIHFLIFIHWYFHIHIIYNLSHHRLWMIHYNSDWHHSATTSFFYIFLFENITFTSFIRIFGQFYHMYNVDIIIFEYFWHKIFNSMYFLIYIEVTYLT